MTDAWRRSAIGAPEMMYASSPMRFIMAWIWGEKPYVRSSEFVSISDSIIYHGMEVGQTVVCALKWVCFSVRLCRTCCVNEGCDWCIKDRKEFFIVDQVCHVQDQGQKLLFQENFISAHGAIIVCVRVGIGAPSSVSSSSLIRNARRVLWVSLGKWAVCFGANNLQANSAITA